MEVARRMTAADLSGHWKTVRRNLLQALVMLTDEQLSFTPGEGLRTVGQVACHIAEAEEGWFGYCVTRKLAEWPSYQAEKHATVDSLVTLLGDVHDRTEVYLAAQDAADLHREFRSPWGEAFTPGDVIWHVMQHEIHHRGEIYLMLGLLGLEAPEV